MAKKDYLARQRVAQQELLNIGETIGRQMVTDMFMCVLADYSIMGNKKLKPEEQVKVLRATEERLSYFFDAWCKSDEADYRQEELDALLKEAVPEGMFVPFRERYQYLKEYNYKTGKWGK